MIGAPAAVALALAAPPPAQVSVSAQPGTQAETAAAAHAFWTDSRDLAARGEEISTTALDAAAYLH
jgi:hypothetical protein